MHELIEVLRSLETPWNMIVLVVLISCIASVIKAVAKQSRTYASHRAELNLKRELVERGLSVDEIERVMAAKSSMGSSTNS
jgi:hypothetical protein